MSPIPVAERFEFVHHYCRHGEFQDSDYFRCAGGRHCRAGLPKYAVPVFVRLVDEPLTTGNHKQNKVPLKAEGVDPDKVSNGNKVLWVQDGKGDTYVPFTKEDWKGLTTGRAKL